MIIVRPNYNLLIFEFTIPNTEIVLFANLVADIPIMLLRIYCDSIYETPDYLKPTSLILTKALIIRATLAIKVQFLAGPVAKESMIYHLHF